MSKVRGKGRPDLIKDIIKRELKLFLKRSLSLLLIKLKLLISLSLLSKELELFGLGICYPEA